MNKVYDMLEFRANSKSRVFHNRNKGLILRKKLNLDKEDKLLDSIILFKFPEDTVSLTSTYFLGLFGDSVRNLGEEEFKRKYKFEGPEHILQSVIDGIHRTLRENFMLR